MVSNIFYFHHYLRKMNPFWLIFFRWVGSTTNQLRVLCFFWGVVFLLETGFKKYPFWDATSPPFSDRSPWPGSCSHLPSSKLTWQAGTSPFPIGNYNFQMVDLPASYVSLPKGKLIHLDLFGGEASVWISSCFSWLDFKTKKVIQKRGYS